MRATDHATRASRAGLVQGPADECTTSEGRPEGWSRGWHVGRDHQVRGEECRPSRGVPTPLCSAAVSSPGRSRHGSPERAVRARERSPIQSLAASWTRAKTGRGEPTAEPQRALRPHHLGSSGATGMMAFSPSGTAECVTHHAVGHPRRAAADRMTAATLLPWASSMRTASGVGGWSSRTISRWTDRRRAGSAPRTCSGMTVEPVEPSRLGGPAVTAPRRRGERRRAGCGNVGGSSCGLRCAACPAPCVREATDVRRQNLVVRPSRQAISAPSPWCGSGAAGPIGSSAGVLDEAGRR